VHVKSGLKRCVVFGERGLTRGGLWHLTSLSTIFQSVLLVLETAVPGKKNTNLPHITDKLDHIMLYWVHLAWAWFKLTMLMVIGTDCIVSWKPNNHRIMTMMAQRWEVVAHFVDICVTVDHHFLFIKWWK
jgi:hypothetical protein